MSALFVPLPCLSDTSPTREVQAIVEVIALLVQGVCQAGTVTFVGLQVATSFPVRHIFHPLETSVQVIHLHHIRQPLRYHLGALVLPQSVYVHALVTLGFPLLVKYVGLVGFPPFPRGSLNPIHTRRSAAHSTQCWRAADHCTTNYLNDLL